MPLKVLVYTLYNLPESLIEVLQSIQESLLIIPIDKDPDVKPVIINSRTMLPLRFVAENLGCTVNWDPMSRTIKITYTP